MVLKDLKFYGGMGYLKAKSTPEFKQWLTKNVKIHGYFIKLNSIIIRDELVIIALFLVDTKNLTRKRYYLQFSEWQKDNLPIFFAKEIEKRVKNWQAKIKRRSENGFKS